MKKNILIVLLLMLVSAVFANAVYETQSSVILPAESGKITEFEKYGHAVLDISIEDFLESGYELGDTVDVIFSNGYRLTNIPFYNGYYVAKGQPMLRAYPGHKNIAVCINYGKIYEVAGLKIGDTCTIVINTKAGALETQLLNSLVYTKNRDAYASDEIFANFRMITSGNIAPGKLYRSASPIDPKYNRNTYADKLAENAGIKSVINLANSQEEVDKLASRDSYYKRITIKKHVVALNMPVDFSSPSFAQKLVDGFITVVKKKFPTPVLIHCTEGKDRAGFTAALVEALMGASEQEIIADYMTSYYNYYGISRETDPVRYDLIVKNNIAEMLKTIKGNSKDLQSGADSFFLNNGMTNKQLKALKSALSK